MKITRRLGTPETPQPKRPTTPRPRVLHRSPPRPTLPHDAPRDLPPATVPLGDENLRRWFEEEAEALQRLAHTQRLKGDYVAAQALEREIRVLASQTTALLEAGRADPRG